MILELLINFWDSINLNPFFVLEQSKILFWILLTSFTVITTKFWIDERRELTSKVNKEK